MRYESAITFANQFLVDHVIGPQVLEEIVSMIEDVREDPESWTKYIASPQASNHYFNDVYSDLLNDEKDPVFNCVKITQFLQEFEENEWDQLCKLVGKYVHKHLVKRVIIK